MATKEILLIRIVRLTSGYNFETTAYDYESSMIRQSPHARIRLQDASVREIPHPDRCRMRVLARGEVLRLSSEKLRGAEIGKWSMRMVAGMRMS
jgi:hypothetical protein